MEPERSPDPEVVEVVAAGASLEEQAARPRARAAVTARRPDVRARGRMGWPFGSFSVAFAALYPL
jgi:hypothetical protein